MRVGCQAWLCSLLMNQVLQVAESSAQDIASLRSVPQPLVSHCKALRLALPWRCLPRHIQLYRMLQANWQAGFRKVKPVNAVLNPRALPKEIASPCFTAFTVMVDLNVNLKTER